MDWILDILRGASITKSNPQSFAYFSILSSTSEEQATMIGALN